MIVVLGAVLGAIIGSTVAHRRKGNRADILQYGVVYAMAFAVLGLFITLIIHRVST
ncbi:MAG: hypothetical protein AAFO72_09000 [Pseudomonadota bacterium]